MALSMPLGAGQASANAPPTAAETRALAWKTLTARVSQEKYLSHSLAVEAIMRAMAGKRDDLDLWGLAGLLHDVDIATTAGDPTRHGVDGAQTLRRLGFSEAVAYAVNAHDDRAGVARISRMDHALFCADQSYWLLRAAAPAFPSAEFNAAKPDDLWEKARALPSKQPMIGVISAECEKATFSMTAVFAMVHEVLKQAPLRSPL